MRPEDEDYPETDLPHLAAVNETGFWGREGAGCIVLARDTGRLLLGHRSKDVLEPDTWGTFGGALDEGLTPEEGVLKELEQETGHAGPVSFVLLSVFVSPKGDFRYSNFLAVIDAEFTPRLNWENQGYAWTGLDALPEPLHFGMEVLLADAVAVETIRAEVGACSGVAPGAGG